MMMKNNLYDIHNHNISTSTNLITKIIVKELKMVKVEVIIITFASYTHVIQFNSKNFEILYIEKR